MAAKKRVQVLTGREAAQARFDESEKLVARAKQAVADAVKDYEDAVRTLVLAEQLQADTRHELSTYSTQDKVQALLSMADK